MATFPLGRLLSDLQAIPGAAYHAPFYFLLLKLWMAVAGDSEAALRSLSVALSLALLPVTYALGRRLLSREAALLGVLLLAISPAQLFFAQEVRMYAALALLTTAAALAYAAWWEARSGRRALALLAAYAVLGVLALYTHYVAALWLAVLNLHALVALAVAGGWGIWRDGRAWSWAAAQLAVGLAFLPYFLGVDHEAAAASQGWRHPLGWEGATHELLRYPLELVHGIYHHVPELQRRAADFWDDRGSGSAAARFREALLVFPLLVLALVAVLAHPPRARSGGVPAPRALLYLALLVPLAVGALISVRQGLQLSRYFLPCAPYLALLLGGGLARLGAAGRAAALAVLLLGAGYGIARYWQVSERDSDYRPAARLLRERAAAGDEILALPADNHVSLLYYLRDTPLESRGIEAAASVPTALDASRAARVWLVVDYRSPLHGLSPRRLREELGREPLVQRRFGRSWGVLVVAVPGGTQRAAR